MDQMLALLQALAMASKEKEDIDLLRDEPGYKDFVAASDAEYDDHDHRKAKLLYERACEAGHPMALCNYALWYLEGTRKGVKKDLKKAFQMFERSAERGIGMAQYNLANFYYTGKGGVEKDFEKAMALAKKSIKDKRVDQMRQGDPYFLLGTLYLQGEGCQKNPAKAHKYFEKARKFGHPGVNAEMLRMVNLLEQLNPWNSQRESDARWDKMCAWVDQHPEKKAVTMADHLRILNRFGFDVHHTLTPREERIKGGFDKFMEITGGSMHMIENYEMEDAEQPPKKCGKCGKRGATKKCQICGEPYCNRVCQKSDWKEHKKVCSAVASAMN